jgi:hypothetical protein
MATVATLVNYDRNTFIVQATDHLLDGQKKREVPPQMPQFVGPECGKVPKHFSLSLTLPQGKLECLSLQAFESSLIFENNARKFMILMQILELQEQLAT